MSLESLKTLLNTPPEYCTPPLLPFFRTTTKFSKLLGPQHQKARLISVTHEGIAIKTGTIKSLINRLCVNKTADKKVKYLTIYTQNIWFDRQDAEERFAEIVNFIEEYQPDFVCLQECIAAFLARLKQSEIITRTYYISQNLENWYEVQILSKWPCQVFKIPYTPHTVMGRSLLVASAVINGSPITISTTHLESTHGSAGYQPRCEQMKCVFDVLKTHPNSMIMGDFNFDAVKDPEEKAIDKSFVDLYSMAHEGTLDYTFIPRKDRLDRMLFRGTDWEATNHYYLVGTKAIKKYEGMSLFEGLKVRSMSDHLGIISAIKYKQET